MVKLLIIYLGFLLIKVVLVILPGLVKNIIIKTIPKRKYTSEEVIACKHMRPDLYYKKQLTGQELMRFESTNVCKKDDISFIREQFKEKMKNRQLTRCQIIAIRRYLEQLVDCKQKKFSNDCHCIYYCLKRLDSEQIVNVTALLNLLN